MPRSGASGAASVDVGQDSVRHAPAVLAPGQAVLAQALLLVPGLAVHQQCREVEDVEIGQQVRHSCGEVEAVTAQQAPSSRRFPLRMAHRDIGALVKGPGLPQSAGSARQMEVCPQPLTESVPSFLTAPSTGAHPRSPFHTQTGHPVVTTSVPHTRRVASVLCPPNPLTTGQGPGQSHDEVSKVVGMADHTPPPRHQQLPPRGCGDGLKAWGKTGNGMGTRRKPSCTPSLMAPRNPAHQPLWGQKDSSGRCSSGNWLLGRCSNQQLGESTSKWSALRFRAFYLTLTIHPQPSRPGGLGPSPSPTPQAPGPSPVLEERLRLRTSPVLKKQNTRNESRRSPLLTDH